MILLHRLKRGDRAKRRCHLWTHILFLSRPLLGQELEILLVMIKKIPAFLFLPLFFFQTTGKQSGREEKKVSQEKTDESYRLISSYERSPRSTPATTLLSCAPSLRAFYSCLYPQSMSNRPLLLRLIIVFEIPTPLFSYVMN